MRMTRNMPRAVLLMLIVAATGIQLEAGEVVEAALNGLELTFDAETGCLLKMSYAGVGSMLDTKVSRSSLIDVAYPIPAFEPLRLAARYSKNARIEKTPDKVTITWDRLGMSREVTADSAQPIAHRLEYDPETKRNRWTPYDKSPFDIEGHVSAEVTFEAAPDGRSVLMRCRVDNQSANPIPQVLFPDFMGLVPFAGEADTEFRTCGFVSRPFQELKFVESSVGFYAGFAPLAGVEYSALDGKWMDVGSRKGGFSLFCKRWNFGPAGDVKIPPEKVWLQLSELDNRLRMACMRTVDIKPKQQWESEEYLLTPHQHGWAKGVEPYREFVRANLKREREFPLPKHVRDGLGFRTVWMTQSYPNDPDGDYAFKCADLPRLARESKEHGLDEMCLWAWYLGMQVPLTQPFPQIGTEEEMAAAIKECKEIGVNVNLFTSQMSVANPTAARWGLSVAAPGSSWTYHTELVPVFRAPYAFGLSIAAVALTDERWQNEVYESMRHTIDHLSPSIGWDQFSYYPESELHALTKKIRRYATARDPNATFSGEPFETHENDAIYLDYLWTWGSVADQRAGISVFPTPRMNYPVERSPRAVKLQFIDNMYMNIFPSKPGGSNGSALISDYPKLSTALKQCAALRKQFLPYFVEGTLIGDCLLTEPASGAYVSAYVLPDRVLMIALAETPNVRLNVDLAPWLAAASSEYQMTRYSEDNQRQQTTELKEGPTEITVNDVQPGSLLLFEIVKK